MKVREQFEDEGHLIIRNIPTEEEILSGREKRKARRKVERKRNKF